ncbi:MAG: hypothetical protein AAGB00_11485 [Planctomycetota bacterium]
MNEYLARIAALLVVANAVSAAWAERFVDLGGPATGYLAISNFKNSATQDGIENKNGETNGLPGFPNYQLAPADPQDPESVGLFTAIIALPQSTASDYSGFAGFSTGFSGGSFTVNNQSVTQPRFSSVSAGRIEYDNSLVTGSGVEQVGIVDLTFNFDTLAYDGSRGGDAGNVSPFSPIGTLFNDGSAFGNAAVYYNLSLSNVTGSGLTFQDGELVSMDIDADLTVATTSAFLTAFPAVNYTGAFNASGLNYSFSVNQQQDFPFNVFTDVNMIFNRAGTASVVPEPGAAGWLVGLFLIRAGRRREPPACA